MSEQQTDTEEQILEAAFSVFQEKGYAGARMQEIADQANINKSMLHYYFRSKDKLFQKIFQESIRNFFPQIFKVLNADTSLEVKVGSLVETYYGMFRKQPHLPGFIIHEMNQHPQRFKDFMGLIGVEIPQAFIKQIRSEIESGTIKKIDPRDFVINTIALCVFPLIARPMVETVFELDEKEYWQFLENRRKALPGYILNTVKT